MLCLDLLNTSSSFYSTSPIDPLLDATWLAQWANKRNLPTALLQQEQTPPALIQLRTQLRRLLDKVLTKQTLDHHEMEFLNEYLHRSHQVRVVSRGANGYQLQTIPLELDLNWLLAEIAASFAELLSKQDPERIKVCGNPDCGWLFYDESRGRTRRWCDDSCGNLMKVRRFRQRQK